MKNNYIFRRKLSKLHKKDTILHVAITFSLKQRQSKQTVDQLLCPERGYSSFLHKKKSG